MDRGTSRHCNLDRASSRGFGVQLRAERGWESRIAIALAVLIGMATMSVAAATVANHGQPTAPPGAAAR